MRKSAFDVQNDNNGDGSRSNWFNLDGTPVAVCDESVWERNAGDRPNNSGDFNEVKLPSTNAAKRVSHCSNESGECM